MTIFFYKRDRARYGWMSNFSKSPFCLGGIIYKTNEHWFQSQKPLAQDQRDRIAQAASPKEAKALGRKLTNLRKDWEDVKEHVMLIGLHAKFAQNPELLQKLVETDEETLVEDSPYDDYWGAPNGKGKNRLGVLLMRLRAYLRVQRQLANVQVWHGMVLDVKMFAQQGRD
jgi:hypothetical protein